MRVAAADGSEVVGTDRALHLGVATVLAWHQVDRARWARDDHTLEVVTLPTGAAPAQTYRVQIPEPGRLPELVRERVTSNILVSERVVLAGRVGARIVARRMPGAEGVRWSVIYDQDDAPVDPDVPAAARDAIASLRSRLGV